MKAKKGYVLKKVMGSYMLVATDAEFNTMQTMNETGAFLWDLLQSDTDINTMTAKMVEEYAIDADTAKKDIEAFIDKLQNASLLDE